jgi:hypothetical protein
VQHLVFQKVGNTSFQKLNTTLGYSFHFQHRNSRTFTIKSLVNYSGCTLVCAEYSLSEGISKYQQLKKKSYATTLNTVLASAHIQMT